MQAKGICPNGKIWTKLLKDDEMVSNTLKAEQEVDLDDEVEISPEQEQEKEEEKEKDIADQVESRLPWKLGKSLGEKAAIKFGPPYPEHAFEMFEHTGLEPDDYAEFLEGFKIGGGTFITEASGPSTALMLVLATSAIGAAYLLSKFKRDDAV